MDQDNRSLSPIEAARMAQATKVMALMAEGKTQKAALSEVGMSRRQFIYWMQKDGGSSELSDMVQEKAVDALLRVMEGYEKAIDELVKIATGPEVRATDKIAAIKEMRVMLGEALGPARRHAGDPDEPGSETPPKPAAFEPGFITQPTPADPASQPKDPD